MRTGQMTDGSEIEIESPLRAATRAIESDRRAGVNRRPWHQDASVRGEIFTPKARPKKITMPFLPSPLKFYPQGTVRESISLRIARLTNCCVFPFQSISDMESKEKTSKDKFVCYCGQPATRKSDFDRHLTSLHGVKRQKGAIVRTYAEGDVDTNPKCSDERRRRIWPAFRKKIIRDTRPRWRGRPASRRPRPPGTPVNSAISLRKRTLRPRRPVPAHQKNVTEEVCAEP